MNHIHARCIYALILSAFTLLPAVPGRAQTGTAALHGRVTDPTSSSVPGATVMLRGAQNKVLTRTTDVQGQYSFAGLQPGKYTISVTKPGFAPAEMQDFEITGNVTLDFPMTVAAAAQEVTVSDQTSQVSTDSNSNASSLVLRGEDLEALSDDPDQLQDDLQALAGPSAGPDGGQIFIDGFTGGTLPPKSSIREVRVNQNPFSAEYDRLGFGRIEIFTKPGTDKFRGQFMTMFSDNVFNARNPFVSERPNFQSRLFEGVLSGPLTKKSSFTMDVEHRGIDEYAVVNAKILDPNLQPASFSESILTPQSRWNVVPRIDYQLTPGNTLTARYSWSRIDNQNQGVGDLSLNSRAYDVLNTDHTIQITETAVLSPSSINETRFQYRRSRDADYGSTAVPAVQVLDAFTAGGNQIGQAFDNENLYELQNMTSKTAGQHSWKFGGRLRIATLADVSPANFGGTFTFTGVPSAPELDGNNQAVVDANGNPVMMRIDSLEQYRRTQLFLGQGLSPAQVRALGGGASQFQIAGGNPRASLNQADVGVFLLDDWRLRPNFTLSYGLRYETQNNIHDWLDFAPRLSFAWGIDGGKRPAKTVLRAGFGMFYSRFENDLTLQAERYNGVTQQQYVVANPDFYPNVPPIDTLTGGLLAQRIREKDSKLRAPYIAQAAVSVERQLPRNTTVSLTYAFSRGLHLLRTRDINAPLPSGVRPYGDLGSILLYESTGMMRQHQLITNVNTRFTRYVSLFAFYVLNNAKGDTDGASTLPANSYDLHDEWGSTRWDIRHRVFLGGSVTMPSNITLSPFVTASSGQPFNIITGIDNNNDLTNNTDRPAFASDPATGVITPWGAFIVNPKPGDKIIPRNYGRGPAQFSVNMRLSRTWGFGESRGGGGAQAGGGRGPAPAFGGIGRHGGHGHGGLGGMFGNDGSTGRRYNLTLGLTARNIFNFVNLAPPNGDLSSPLFGESTQLARGFGPATSASNRRIDLQLRFSF